MKWMKVELTRSCCFVIIFFNDTATTEIYTLSLHDALPIFAGSGRLGAREPARARDDARVNRRRPRAEVARACASRSEEHTSELQSRQYLVCRLLLEKNI